MKKKLFALVLLCALRLTANDLESRILNKILIGMNPNKDPVKFLNEDLYTKNAKGVQSSSFFEFLAFSDKAYYENIFYLKYTDKSNFLRDSEKYFSEGKMVFSGEDIKNLQCVPYLSENNGRYFVGDFSINKLSESKLIFVLSENYNLQFLGVLNKDSNLLSKSLPIYKSDYLTNEPFRKFDLDILEYLKKNKGKSLIN